jgi:hypothetical protein
MTTCEDMTEPPAHDPIAWEEEEDRIAPRFLAAGDPTGWSEELYAAGERGRITMPLTGMKKHVRLLEEAQLVTTEKVGRVRRCMLVPDAFEGISTWLQRLDRFAQVVQRTKGAR